MPPSEATAVVNITTDVNEHGRDQECVFATCESSGTEVGPIWGDTEMSVLRALATLSEQCACGAKFHIDKDHPPPKIPDWEKRRHAKKQQRAEDVDKILSHNAEIVLHSMSLRTPAGWSEEHVVRAIKDLFKLWAPDLNLKLPTKATKSPNGVWTAVTEERP